MEGYRPEYRKEKQLVRSRDGSCTLYSCEFEEAYHSTRDGALNESLHKHVLPAFKLQRGKPHLRILDICFGLGYNTFSTLYYVKKHNLPVTLHIVSPEFDEGLVRSLEGFDYPAEFDLLRPIIRAISRELCYEDAQFKIEVILGDARQTIPVLSAQCTAANATDITFDIIYQDAFSPRKNPLLWTREWFADLRLLCRDDAVLTTYSVASAVRFGLYENGFGIYLNRKEGIRDATVASLRPLEGYPPVDMAHKKRCNPDAGALLDSDYL